MDMPEVGVNMDTPEAVKHLPLRTGINNLNLNMYQVYNIQSSLDRDLRTDRQIQSFYNRNRWKSPHIDKLNM